MTVALKTEPVLSMFLLGQIGCMLDRSYIINPE